MKRERHVLVQSHPAEGHGDHPLGPWQLLGGQAAGVGGVQGQDPGVDEARPQHREGAHLAHYRNIWMREESDEL